MTPDEDAIIIREHARLREKLMSLTALKQNGHYFIRRDQILGILHLTEDDKLPPRKPYEQRLVWR